MVTSRNAESIDRAYDVLGDYTRRLRYLSARPERRVTINALCQTIARAQSGRNGAPHDADRLTLECHHIHLPKLAATDLIDSRSVRPERAVSGPFVEQLLAAIPEEPR